MNLKIVVSLFFVWCLTIDSKGQEYVIPSHPVLDSINKMVKSGDQFSNWWTYHYNIIKLSSDFIGIDEDSAVVVKKEFLTHLQTGEYIAFKLDSSERKPVYMLSKIDSYDYESISNTIRGQADMALVHYELEGKPFPDIEEKSISGLSLDIKNRKGKFILFKTWFIGCKACILEFPELNEMVESQKGNDNILFISLATDEREELSSFLTKRPFSYEVIPNQKSLMNNLNIPSYPTHILVDENNIIVKVCGNVKDLEMYIEKYQIFEK